jgi:hypothetical protein
MRKIKRDIMKFSFHFEFKRRNIKNEWESLKILRSTWKKNLFFFSVSFSFWIKHINVTLHSQNLKDFSPLGVWNKLFLFRSLIFSIKRNYLYIYISVSLTFLYSRHINLHKNFQHIKLHQRYFAVNFSRKMVKNACFSHFVVLPITFAAHCENLYDTIICRYT